MRERRKHARRGIGFFFLYLKWEIYVYIYTRKVGVVESYVEIKLNKI